MHPEDQSINNTSIGNTLAPLQTTFSFTSVFFLVLVSLKLAHPLIRPLRHRLANVKGYVFGVPLAWVAVMSVETFTLQSVREIFDFVYSRNTFGCNKGIYLITVCMSYLAIRKRLIITAELLQSMLLRTDKIAFNRTPNFLGLYLL